MEANYLYLDGTIVREPIIGVGGTGIVVSRRGYAYKIPLISKIIKIDGVPFDDPGYPPKEGDYDERATAIKAFENEKAIYRRLGDHAGIIRCYNLLSADPSIQMPLMEGDLRHYLDDQTRPTKATLLSWLTQLAHAMAHIHSRRVIVGDFRLDNIVFDGNMSIKLVDFSESSLMPPGWNLDGCDENGFSIGTDIGQFGAAMFDMITGQRCAFDIYHDWKQVGDRPTWPRRDTLPSTRGVWLGSIIEKCWTKGFVSAQDLAEALEKECVC
jgi:serine/threonine protein kinase